MNVLEKIFWTALLLTAWPSGRGVAAPWRMESGFLSKAIQRNLLERHPEINTPGDLMRLIEDIGRKADFLQVDAQYIAASVQGGADGSGAFVISLRHARVIGEVDVDSSLRDIGSQLQSMAKNVEGQVDTAAMRAKIESDFVLYLNHRGFFEAKVVVKPVVDNSDENSMVVYNAKVIEGEPCIIDKVDMSVKLPLGILQGVSVGDICDEESIRQTVDKLLESVRGRGYNQARIELAGLTRHKQQNSATVHIGGILGKRIRYQVRDRSTTLRIDDLFAQDELSGIDPTIVGPDAMAAELTRRYRSRGFSEVAVTGPKQERPSDDEIVYVFDVEPGRQYTLRGVNFEGAQRFSDRELMSLMNLKGFWQNTSAPLDPEMIRAGVEAIKGRYQAAGYWDVVVRDRPPSRDQETGNAQITIAINEGALRVLGSIQVQGAKFFESGSLMQLAEEDGILRSDVPLDRSSLFKLQQAIRARYFSAGFLYADVKLDMAYRSERKKILVDIVIEVFEGIRVKIGNISVSGLARTKGKVVLRELRFEAGDWYDPMTITESRRALVALGLFRSVQILPLDRNALADEEPELDILVDVREGKAGNVAFGPGWSLADGYRFNTEATYSNISGLGRQVSVRAGFSQELRQVAIGNKTLVGRNIGAGYVEPYVLDLPFDFTVSANNQARSTETAWELSRFGELALTRKLRWLGTASHASLFYGQKFTRQESDGVQKSALLSDDIRIGFVGIRANIDKRNDSTWPTRGYTLIPELSVARFALGGDLRYLRSDINYARYFGFGSRFVLALGASVTTFHDVEREGSNRSFDLLPPSERLYVGGADTVRGFRERSLGPLVRSPHLDEDGFWDCSFQSNRSGGSRRVVLKFEGRYRLSETLATTLFLDNGNVFFSEEEGSRLARAFADPVEVKGSGSDCPASAALRSVEDNNGYSLRDLRRDPRRLWSDHYTSYGTSVNFLTAIGSVNFAYGLPLHEPQSKACAVNDSLCFPRGKQKGYWLTRGEFDLNVGARF